MILVNEFFRFFINFSTQIFVISLAFVLPFKLKKNGLIPFLIGSIAFLLTPYLYRAITNVSFYSSFFFMIGWYSISYVVLCSCLGLIYYFSFDVSGREIILILCLSYLFQNIIYNFSRLIPIVIPGIPSLILQLLNLVFISGLWTTTYILGKKRILHFDSIKMKRYVIFIITVSLVILLTVVSQWVITFAKIEDIDQPASMLYGGIAAVELLIILLMVFNNTRLKYDNIVIVELLKKTEKQIQISQENVDYINWRIHDIKHQIAAIKVLIENNQKSEVHEKILELEKLTKLYDDMVLTGNTILDSLLAEQKLLCDKNQIQLDYMIDGTILDFIEAVDLYVMFGNAIENAIESVLKIKDVSKRIISIMVSKKDKLVYFSIQNPYNGTIEIFDGIPKTNKKDKEQHGFGIKSIKYIAQKYGGNITISAENGHFYLSILIPEKKRCPVIEASATEEGQSRRR